MKIVTCLMTLFFLIISISALAQDDYDIKDINDILRTNSVKKIDKPYHAPPPAFYQYVPDEIVIKLKEDIKLEELRYEAEQIVTGCVSLDELYKRYEVKYIKREFPDPPERDLTQLTDELRKYYIVKFSAQYDIKEVCERWGSTLPWYNP